MAGDMLDALEISFSLLVRGPAPACVDGTRIGHGLPARPIPLDELRELLAAPGVPAAAHDVAVRLLVGHARTQRDAALIGLVGVLLPGLRGAVEPMLRANPAAAGDLEVAVLSGLVDAIDTIGLHGCRLADQVVCRAARAGYALLADGGQQRTPDEPGREGWLLVRVWMGG